MRSILNKIALLIILASCINKKQKANELTCATKDEGLCGNAFLNVQEPAVFKSNCSTCHTLHKMSTGPKLLEVFDHVPSENWFFEFVTNEDSLTKVKDEYTLKIQKWSPVDGNHNYKNLTREELNEIAEYLKQN